MKFEKLPQEKQLEKFVTELAENATCTVTYHEDDAQKWLAQISFENGRWHHCGFGDTKEEAVIDAISRSCKSTAHMLSVARTVAALHNVPIAEDERDREIENLKQEIARLTPVDAKPYRPF